MIACWVLGDDLALEAREGIGEERRAAAAGLPADAREPIRPGVGGARDEALVVGTEHVDREPARATHARPRVRATRRTDRDQTRLERD